MNKKLKIIICIIVIIVITGILIFVLINRTKKSGVNYDERIEEILSDNKEIEKKWLIDISKIPYDLTTSEKYVIEQTYICFSPELRVRRINNGEQYTFAVKANMTIDGMTRDEVELEITKEEYEDLLAKKAKDTITIDKTRYQFLNEEGQILAIDIFEEELKGLAYLEIEFANEEEANKYVEPSWVIKDVTSNSSYKNGSLARYGIPNKN